MYGIDFQIPTFEIPNWSDGTNRWYKTPEGDIFPSVSSVAKLLQPPGIEEWKAEVGAEVASAIASKAANRGTHIHKLCEQYLLSNHQLTLDQVPIVLRQQMKQLFPILDEITDPLCEMLLYSTTLKVAGRTDCIGMFRGQLSVIDFKQSNQDKTADDIPHYFAQEAAYAQCANEHGFDIEQLVTIMVVRGYPYPLIFVEKRSDHIDAFRMARVRHSELYLRPDEPPTNPPV